MSLPFRRPGPTAVRRALSLLAAALAACAAPRAEPDSGSAAPEAGPSRGQVGAPIDPELALSTFDAVWTIVRDEHFDPALGGLDWEAVRDELRPRASAATREGELREVLRHMLARLGQSHFALLPPRPRAAEVRSEAPDGPSGAGGAPLAAEPGLADPGLDVRLRAGRVLVSSVRPDSPAWQAGVRPGWVLTAIGDRPCEELLERFRAEPPRAAAAGLRGALRKRLAGEESSTVRLTLRDERDRPRRLELERRTPERLTARFGNLPTFQLEFEESIERAGERRVGRIRFSNWFLPVARPIDEAIDRMRNLDGILIDLRGNGGGALALVMGVAGHFFSERAVLGEQVSRAGSMTYRANPRLVGPTGERVEPFAGPLAILVDETTGSASEVFAGALQAAGRARVFGETSAGAVLPARTTELPNGDVLLHAFADFHTTDGTRLEGRGVVPDEVVPLTRSALLEGRDPQIAAALLWLSSAGDVPPPQGEPR